MKTLAAFLFFAAFGLAQNSITITIVDAGTTTTATMNGPHTAAMIDSLKQFTATQTIPAAKAGDPGTPRYKNIAAFAAQHFVDLWDGLRTQFPPSAVNTERAALVTAQAAFDAKAAAVKAAAAADAAK